MVKCFCQTLPQAISELRLIGGVSRVKGFKRQNFLQFGWYRGAVLRPNGWGGAFYFAQNMRSAISARL
ncbi:MAG: hypothetical protein DBY45_02510 [Clostridiales bacterium]|nr:MAG: hypothetical protein DBY45_02510 [Clostridiales bacterium]